MCWCTPSIRTPFCGRADCHPPRVDFAKAPKSLGEARADKSHRASDWTPRDALVDLLRQIDAGELDVDTVVIGYRVRPTKEMPHGKAAWQAASPDPLITAGLVAHVLARITDA
jgi:hypothetical protein